MPERRPAYRLTYTMFDSGFMKFKMDQSGFFEALRCVNMTFIVLSL